MASAPEQPARTRVSRRQFSLRALLLGVAFFALAALGGKWLHEAWLRREVQTLVTLPFASVNLFTPHIDTIVRDSPTIAALQVDNRTNSLILTAQYRNLEAARAELLWLVEHPAVLEAASILGLSLPEAVDLYAANGGFTSLGNRRSLEILGRHRSVLKSAAAEYRQMKVKQPLTPE